MEPKPNRGNITERYRRLEKIARRELSSSAHDMEHLGRVCQMCLRLAEDERDIDLDVLRTAALLHDIGRDREDQDNSGDTDHALLAAEMAERILRDMGDSEERIESVKHCIIAHRFRSSTQPRTKEARIFFDADKLDVIGAIGIARIFMIAGQYGEKMFSNAAIAEYVRDNLLGGRPTGRIKDISKHSPNIEFETKLRHIPDKLYTQKAKEIAEGRMRFMIGFFDRLEAEIKRDD